MSSLEDMIQEASMKEISSVPDPLDSNRESNALYRASVDGSTAPMTRQSLQQLAGDENDLLSESPVFQKAKNVVNEKKPEDMMVGRNSSNIAESSMGAAMGAPPQEEDDKIDEKLMQEIETYLQGVLTNNEQVMEMDNNIIKSAGALQVAAAIEFCTSLQEVRLSNCSIGDSGAMALFDMIADSKNIQVLDLSANPITDKSF